MKKKTLYGIIALIIAAAIVIVAGIGSSVNGKWFKNKDIQTWFNSWGQESSQEETLSWGGVIDNVGNTMNETETTYAMPAAMAFYATVWGDVAQNTRLAAPSVTVTCSHNFEFNNVLVDWSVEYPSGASASDVVTVTPTSDGSLTATLTCLGAFSEPLTLKATLRGNSEKTATCRLDYVKRIDTAEQMRIMGTDFGDSGGIECKLYFTDGTVNANLKANVTYFLIDDFEEAVQRYLKFNISFNNYNAENLELTEYMSIYSADDVEWQYSMFIHNFDDYDEAHKNAIYYAWFAAFTNGNFDSIISIDCAIDLIYNGKKIDCYRELDYFSVDYVSILTGDCYGYDVSPDLILNTNVAL